MASKLTEQESLQIIESMIAQARFKPTTMDSLLTLMWGYLVMVAALGHWALLYWLEVPWAPAVWLLMVVGGVITLLYDQRVKQERKAKTYVEVLVRNIWLAFGISYACVLLGMQPDHEHFLPAVLVLYGMSSWVHGVLIKFSPYRWGAIASWVAGAVAFILPVGDQLLVLAGAAVLGYIVPGHLLLQQTKNKDHV